MQQYLGQRGFPEAAIATTTAVTTRTTSNAMKADPENQRIACLITRGRVTRAVQPPRIKGEEELGTGEVQPTPSSPAHEGFAGARKLPVRMGRNMCSISNRP